MSPGGRAGRGTLRRRVLLIGLAVSLLVVLGLGTFVVLNTRTRASLAEATEAYSEEQRIADELTDAVMRQLLLVPMRSGVPSEGPNPDFQEAGDEAHALIQRYLFRDLTPAQRLQLETVKTEHQRLEVAAARASSLLLGSDPEAAREATASLVEHASTLLEALNRFLAMRASGIDQLRERQNAAFDSFYFAGGGFALFILVGSLYLGRFLQSKVAAPLADLADAARRIGEGELEARVPVHHDQEFADVATAFNRMAAELAHTQAQLEGRNRELAEVLETVRHAQAELVESEKLSAMGRMTAGLAHELNNPLATVLGYGSLLRERIASGEPPSALEVEEEFLAPMLYEAHRARDLVRNFTLFARGSDTQVGPVRLGDALNVVVGLQMFAFERAGLELSVGDIPDVFVRAERQRLQEIFLNIVSNAFDALMEENRSGGLHIEGERRGDTLSLTFEDDGPGVEDLDRLFEPFYTTKIVGQGTGMGLAMVHRVMKDFGGSVRAENRSEGGARFVLTFAVVSPLPDAADLETSTDAVRATAPTPPAGDGHRAPANDAEGPGTAIGASAPGTDRSPGGEAVDPGGETSGFAATKGAAERPRILVVEDELPLRRLQKRILRRLDAEVFVAGSVAEARSILEEHGIDLIVSDLKMPGESGLELYASLREERPELAERFLFVTGDVGDPALADLSTERPGMFIHKPFELEEYLERVSTALKVALRR